MVAAFDDISEVIPHLMSTGTNSYPAFLQRDDNCGQYFLVSSSRSSSSPPNGELKNTRAVFRWGFEEAFHKNVQNVTNFIHSKPGKVTVNLQHASFVRQSRFILVLVVCMAAKVVHHCFYSIFLPCLFVETETVAEKFCAESLVINV